MSFQWVQQPDPNLLGGGPAQAIPPPSPGGYSYYYPRSAQTSPYAQPTLLPTPPVAVSPLPGGPVWLPYYSPNAQAQALPSPGHAPRPQPGPTQPILIDILHPASRRVGAKQPHLIYDLRDFPEKAAVNVKPRPVALSDAHLDAPLTSPPTSAIKVISKEFPWEIDVESADENTPVTIADLINAVHEALQKHITSSEWWIVTDKVREQVTGHYVKNCERSSAGNPRKYEVEKPREKNEGLRRVDWLGDAVVMIGLEKDDAFAAQRFRDKETRAITWRLITSPKH